MHIGYKNDPFIFGENPDSPASSLDSISSDQKERHLQLF